MGTPLTPPRRVLILDDDDNVGHGLCLMAEHLGCQCRSVVSYHSFFVMVEEWSPTHILIDLVMPGMDGVQVLQHLGEMRCDVPIGIMSGVGPRILKAASQSGAEHGLNVVTTLSKPFTLEAFQSFLTNGLAEQTNRRIPVASEDVVVDRITLEAALHRSEFQLNYQPKIDCQTRELVGFEALVRWPKPTGGFVPPDAFIPIAERHNLIKSLTDQIVDMALLWKASTVPAKDLSLSINISALTLSDREFADSLESKCRFFGIDPSRIILEVTETAAMEDRLLALDLFTRLRVKGFLVSIDDFGIGNSSLALLARLPFSEVKVDKSFAMTARSSEESRAIIKSTVDLSRSLNLSVVTEGVEDIETLEYLTVIGCGQAQGYYIAKPMAPEVIPNWIGSTSELSANRLM